MATKAERFRAETERSGPKRPKKVVQPKRRAVSDATSSPGPSHNYAPRAEKGSAYDMEFAAPHKRPSRKSTRKSHNHTKTDSSLRITTMNKVASPEARAKRGKR